VIPLYCCQAPTTASRVETSTIEQQEEEARPTCVAYANEAFVSVANLQKNVVNVYICLRCVFEPFSLCGTSKLRWF